MINTPLTPEQAAMLSGIFRLIPKTITTDDDKEKLLPGELGISYIEGTIYAKDPVSGELISPNSISFLKQILTKYNPYTNIMNADRINGVRYYTSIDELPDIGVERSVDSIITMMEYPATLKVYLENTSTLNLPSPRGILEIIKSSDTGVSVSYHDSVANIRFYGKYDQTTRMFTGWYSPDLYASIEYLQGIVFDGIALIQPNYAIHDLHSVVVTLESGPVSRIRYNDVDYYIVSGFTNSDPVTIQPNTTITVAFDNVSGVFVLYDTSPLAAATRIIRERMTM